MRRRTMGRLAGSMLVVFLAAWPGAAWPQDGTKVSDVQREPAANKGTNPGDCRIGPGMAATLLVPYFEVDLGSPGGVTTLISVNNGFNFDTLARVVLWTDWAMPTLAFDVYLGPFDVVTINFRDLFAGNVPSTGATADLSAYGYCATLPPYHANPVLTQNEIDQLRADHRGLQGPLAGDCAGEPHGDNIARGYATIDVVDECSDVEGFDPAFTPRNTSYPYFEDGGGSGGIGMTLNQLWGDVAYVDSDNNYAQGNELVAVWANDGIFSGTNIYTFYGSLSSWDGRDDRVPLPYRWDQRFLNGGPFSGGATLIVWRDLGEPGTPATCGSVPGWWPLTADVTAVDEDGGAIVSAANTSIPLATQKVDVNDLGIPYPFGWIQVDTHPNQSWVQPSLAAFSRFSASWNGAPVSFFCDESPVP